MGCLRQSCGLLEAVCHDEPVAADHLLGFAKWARPSPRLSWKPFSHRPRVDFHVSFFPRQPTAPTRDRTGRSHFWIVSVGTALSHWPREITRYSDGGPFLFMLDFGQRLFIGRSTAGQGRNGYSISHILSIGLQKKRPRRRRERACVPAAVERLARHGRTAEPLRPRLHWDGGGSIRRGRPEIAPASGRSVLDNCTWKGGVPSTHWMTRSEPLRMTLVIRGGGVRVLVTGRT